MVIMKLLLSRFSLFRHGILGLITLLLSLCSLNANAAFYASVSKNKVAKNEVFQLKVVSEDKASSDDIDFSALDKDFFMSRPSFGSSINIINGTRTNRSEWTVSLAANRVGIMTIPSFELNGEKTQPIAIQVTNDESAPDSDDLVEVKSQLSRTTLYPNESAILKARLIIKADPRRLQDPKIAPPKVDGMELKAASEPNQYQTVIDGIEVTVVDQDFRVTAAQAGQFTLSEPSLKATLVYGSSFNGSTRIIPLNTTPKEYTITVEPKPTDYQGNWLPTSLLTLKERWLDSNGRAIENSRYRTKVGDSITREITLQVTGLSQEQLPDLALNYPDSVRVYDEKPEFNTLDNGDVTMTVKQVLIPRRSGDITLPAISVNWWDTVRKQQQTTTGKGLTLTVKPGDNPAVAAPTPTPVQTPPAGTITIKDPGYWPYLTALFALLWVLTLLLVWRLRVSNRVAPETASQTFSSSYQQLQQTLKGQDGIALSHALKQWQQEVIMTDEENAQLNLAWHELNQALYSATPGSYNSRELGRLVKQIEHNQAKRKKQVRDPLAKL